MKLILFLFSLTLSAFAISADEVKDRMPDYRLIDTQTNSSLDEDQAIFHFNFINVKNGDKNAQVHYSIDSVEFLEPLEDNILSIQTTPGTHSFQFFINENYYESYSPELRIESQQELTFEVQLRSSAPRFRAVSYKPVIYLYPEEAIHFELSVNIHNGAKEFFYPTHADKWLGQATPGGSIEINNETYRYLFWEAEQNDHLQEINVNEGFTVAGTEAVVFLEEKLKSVGFTSQERADFITFWGPKLAANENNLVRFEWNETCDKFADLNISPRPDHLYRFYIFISAVDSSYSITPQVLPTFNRDGFVLLEWGGQVSNYQPNTTP